MLSIVIYGSIWCEISNAADTVPLFISETLSNFLGNLFITTECSVCLVQTAVIRRLLHCNVKAREMRQSTSKNVIIFKINLRNRGRSIRKFESSSFNYSLITPFRKNVKPIKCPFTTGLTTIIFVNLSAASFSKVNNTIGRCYFSNRMTLWSLAIVTFSKCDAIWNANKNRGDRVLPSTVRKSLDRMSYILCSFIFAR